MSYGPGLIGKLVQLKSKGLGSYCISEVFIMGTRLDLQTLFETILDSKNVYFQPPPGHMMKYPCIVYNRSNIRSEHGDNVPYKLVDEYEVTVIDKDPDSIIPRKIAQLPSSNFDRNFRSEGLNHDVFTILF